MGLIDRYRNLMKKLLPPGFAFTRGTETQMDALLSGMAEEPARVHDRSGDLLFEMFPDTTTELLTEWETVWGLPDPCAGALDTLSERRAALLARMVHVGQQTPGFFIRVAATLGYTITIEENVDGSPYVWRIISNIIAEPVYARAGTARAGDPIRTWGADMLECAMRALNPAHLDLLFAYIEGAINVPVCNPLTQLVSEYVGAERSTIAVDRNSGVIYAGYAGKLRVKQPTENVFCELADLPSGYYFAKLAVDQDTGTLYAIGYDYIYEAATGPRRQLFVYNEITGIFSPLGDPMPADWWFSSALAVGGGVVYVGVANVGGSVVGCVFSSPLSSISWSLFYSGLTEHPDVACVYCSDVNLDSSGDIYISWAGQVNGEAATYQGYVTQKSGAVFTDIFYEVDNQYSVEYTCRYNGATYMFVEDTMGSWIGYQEAEGAMPVPLSAMIDHSIGDVCSNGQTLYLIENYEDISAEPLVENSAFISHTLAPPVITLLNAQIDADGEYLILEFSEAVFQGVGFSNTYLGLVGSVSGAVGVAYYSGSGSYTLVFQVSGTIVMGESVVFNYSGQTNCLESEYGRDVSEIVSFNVENLVFVEPLYSALSWPCHDEVMGSPVVACTEDAYYNGTLTELSQTVYNQTYEHSELYGYIDYGFRIGDNPTNLPSSVKVPKILPNGTILTSFDLSAGFRFYSQALRDVDNTLFHVRTSAGGVNLQLEWNQYTRTFSLFMNGVLNNSKSLDTLFTIADMANTRTYLKLHVVSGSVTLTHTKTVVDYESGQETTQVNANLCIWDYAAPLSFLNPILYFGGYEYQSFDPYYDLTVGACTWTNLG